MTSRRTILGIGALVIICCIALLGYDGASSRGRIGHEPPAADRITELRIPAAAAADRNGTSSKRALAEAGELWTIRVADSAGNPLSGASVYHHISGTCRELGTTAADGAIRSSLLDGQGEIEARREDYVPKSVRVEGNADRVICVQLVEAGEIRGRVTFVGTGVAGVRVLAIPAAERATSSAVLRALSGDSAVPLVKSGQDGRFVMKGLESGQSYTIMAGGNGFGSKAPTYQVPAVTRTTGGDIELAVLPVYAAVVTCVDEAGEPLRYAPELLCHPPACTAVAPGTETSAAPAHGPMPALFGIPEQFLDLQTVNPRLILYRSKQDSDSIGPVRVYLGLPGYEPLDAEFTIPRLRTELTLITVRVARLATDFSNVTIDISGLPKSGVAWDVRKSQGCAAGALEFRNSDGKGFDIPVWSADESTVRVKGIPYGNYNICFSSAYGYHRGQSIHVRLEHPEENFSISCLPEDSADMGGLLIEVKDSKGADYQGPVAVQLRKGRENRTGLVHFDHGPYVFDFLPAQPIEVTVIPELSRNGGTVPEMIRSKVEIPIGQRALLAVQMKK